MNDIVEPLIEQNGAVNGTVEYLGKIGGKWLGVPATVGSQIKGPSLAHRPDERARRHRRSGNVSRGAAPKADAWTFDAFLKAAEGCHRANHAFGIGLGTTADNVDTAGAIFHGFGAVLVDGKGNIVVRNDAVRQAIDYYRRLMAFLPPDVPSWTTLPNNKWLVSGRGALIMNHTQRLGCRQARCPQGR